MPSSKPSPGLSPMTNALDAPAHLQERTYLNVIAESLKFIEEYKQQRERAEQLPHNQIKAMNTIETSVLGLIGKGGKLVDDKT